MPTTIQYLSLFIKWGPPRLSVAIRPQPKPRYRAADLRVGRHQVKPLDVGFIDNTANGVVVHANMKAELLIDEHYVLDGRTFVEIVVWRLDRPVRGSTHNEAGKVIIGTLVVLKSAIPS